MKILAHRGFWKTETEKNSMVALKRAIECGYGFETDFRDCAGKILISHNPPIGNEVSAEEVFKMYHELGSNEPLAQYKIDSKFDLKKKLDLKIIQRKEMFDNDVLAAAYAMSGNKKDAMICIKELIKEQPSMKYDIKRWVVLYNLTGDDQFKKIVE